MNAKKCDRCGGFYTVEYVQANIFQELGHSLAMLSDKYAKKERIINSITAKVDFCPECSESFEKWLTHTDKEDVDGKQNYATTNDT